MIVEYGWLLLSDNSVVATVFIPIPRYYFKDKTDG